MRPSRAERPVRPRLRRTEQETAATQTRDQRIKVTPYIPDRAGNGRAAAAILTIIPLSIG